MKKFRASSILSLALAGLLGQATAGATTVTPPAAGDIFLGVRATGGQGSGTSLIVDIGNDATFRNATSGTTVSVGNFGADLTAAFGPSWSTRSDLQWGFFGTRNQTNPVVYASRAQSPYGSSATAWPALTIDSRAATNTQIISVIADWSSLNAASTPASALQNNAAVSSSYSYQVGTDGTSDFGSVSRWTSIEDNFGRGPGYTALDLFRFSGNPSSGVDNVERLGAFSFTSAGALSFLAGPVVDQVRVAATTVSAREDSGTLQLTLERLGDHNSTPVDVTFTVTDGTAVAGTDFTAPVSLTASFAASQTTQTVSVPLTNRTGFHGNRTFTLALTSATGGFAVGSPSSTVVTITDADPDPGALEFTAASFAASAADSSVDVTLHRTSGSTGAVDVSVSVTGGTLANGTDFSFTSPTVASFADGVTTATVTINLSANTAGTIVLGLGNPTHFSRLGSQTSATVNVAGAPGVLSFAASKYSFLESAGTVHIPVVRTSGSQGQVSVTVNTANGTAQAPSDYTALVNYTATLDDGQSSFSLPLTLINSQPGETNETFTVTLSSPAGGASLGAITTATIRILEPDSKIPTVTITTPAANARVLATAGPTVSVTGAATDDKGLDRVELQLNGGAWVLANLVSNATATTATYSRIVTPVAGVNTLTVRSVDGSGNISTLVTRTFTYVVIRPLTVNIDQASPAGSGRLSAPFPGTDANREVGKTYTITATPAAGYVFDGWTGVSGPQAELPVLNFVHREGLVLTAKFASNPFKPAVIGDFNGLVTATGATVPSQTTNGFINVKVTATGAFTGTLKIDGLALALSGSFNNQGVARFGQDRSSTAVVTRTDKPSYLLTLALDLDDSVNGTNQITGTLGQQTRAGITPLSIVKADRARYSATDKVPADYQGLYTVIIPSQAQDVGSVLTKADYPQGDGIGSITVTAAGVASLTGTLADGTAITTSAPLSKARTVPLFAQLYNAKGGSFGGAIVVNSNPSDLDITAASGSKFFWFRPFQSGQYYPFGWPEGVTTGFAGAKYAAPAGASAIPGLPAPDDTTGNAILEFSDGGLGSTISKGLNISTTNAVTKIPPTDPSYTLTIAAGTGDVSGTFVHDDGTKPAFKAKIIRKGSQAGAYGFFLTTAPKVPDGTGQSGGISLTHK